MYSFVRGARLFVKGARENDDADNVPDPGDQLEPDDRMVSAGYHQTQAHMSSASQESREVFRTAQSRSGLKTVHTSRVIRKTTTLTRGEHKQAVNSSSEQRHMVTSGTSTDHKRLVSSGTSTDQQRKLVTSGTSTDNRKVTSSSTCTDSHHLTQTRRASPPSPRRISTMDTEINREKTKRIIRKNVESESRKKKKVWFG